MVNSNSMLKFFAIVNKIEMVYIFSNQSINLKKSIKPMIPAAQRITVSIVLLLKFGDDAFTFRFKILLYAVSNGQTQRQTVHNGQEYYFS